MGLGQHNSLGEFRDPYTASSMFLILVFVYRKVMDYCLNHVAYDNDLGTVVNHGKHKYYHN